MKKNKKLDKSCFIFLRIVVARRAGFSIKEVFSKDTSPYNTIIIGSTQHDGR
jgi:hypothetical protein